MPTRIAVLVSGGGTNLQAMLDYNTERGSLAAGQIVVVASNRATAGALDRARNAAIAAEVFDAADEGASLLSLLASHRIELVVLAGYLKRLPSAVIREFSGRIVNIHPGLLPEFGGPGMYGAHVHAAVISSGVKTTGITVHLVDDEYDHGPRIAEWRIPVRDDDTAESLAARVLKVEHTIFPRIVDMIASLHARGFSADY